MEFDSVLILDFGSQYTHLIARRLRELSVYCEIFACNAALSSVPFKPKGLILSGGPHSVYEEAAPHLNKEYLDLNIPILGICYGLQEIAYLNGCQVSPSHHREFGHAALHHVPHPLFENFSDSLRVWMSHGDALAGMPQGFKMIGWTDSSPFAAIANDESKIYGIQFHPEVAHTDNGKVILSNFCLNICKITPNWNMQNFVDIEVDKIRKIVGNGTVIGAVSGGVDSTVAAKLMTLAIGDRFRAVFIDNGLLRLNEAAQVNEMLTVQLGIPLVTIDASKEFLSRLDGITDPEEKRKKIGHLFIELFETEARKHDATFLLQGTLYPDVIESVSYKGPSATIKTHHNVGGLLPNMKLKLVEPLRELFKDEVRAIGALINIPHQLLYRHPFPGPGLAIRILGPVSDSQLSILRQADDIFIQEIRNAGLYDSISQAFCVLLPVQSVGVMGDCRTYEQVIVLRAVKTTDFMTAEWYPIPYDLLALISSKIINKVRGVNRVVYDVSTKPPSTIEWE